MEDARQPAQLLPKDQLHPNRPDQQPPPPTPQLPQLLLLQLNSSRAPAVEACLETSPALQRRSPTQTFRSYILTKSRGVAIGSSVGHAITGFFGGSSAPAAEQPQQNAVATQGNQAAESSWGQRSCDVDAKQFTKCMDENQGNMQICGWYLEQLVSVYKLKK